MVCIHKTSSTLQHQSILYCLYCIIYVNHYANFSFGEHLSIPNVYIQKHIKYAFETSFMCFIKSSAHWRLYKILKNRWSWMVCSAFLRLHSFSQN